MSRDPERVAAEAGRASKDEVEVVIPVVAEELIIQKRQQDTGGVRATKLVTEREQVVNEPLRREQVTVERRVVNRVIDAPAQVRQEGDFLIIPVMEEVLEIKRNLVLKEEIYIRRQQVQTQVPEHFILRSEAVRIEQLPAGGDESNPQPPPISPVEMKGSTT